MAAAPAINLFEERVNRFSFDIYREINGTTNACVSPFSIISALLMLMIGTGGNSKQQIKSAVLKDPWNDALVYRQYKALRDFVFNAEDIEIHIASKLFVMKGLSVKTKVRRISRRYFNAGVRNLDFSKSTKSARIMNRYVARNTNDRIKDLIRPSWLSSLTVMVLVNALYFKGAWVTPFNPKLTKKDYFYISAKNTLQVNMMEMKHEGYFYNGKSFSAVTLPYKGGLYEMVIVLPWRIDGLNDLMASFSPSTAHVIMSGMVKANLTVKIPKFKFESETDLKVLLPKVGIKDIFVAGVADFSNLLEEVKNGMSVTEARHKVFIDVNEFGTEAAAATAIVITRSHHPTMFVANHPFLFYIRHLTTNTILFMGHYKGS